MTCPIKQYFEREADSIMAALKTSKSAFEEEEDMEYYIPTHARQEVNTLVKGLVEWVVVPTLQSHRCHVDLLPAFALRILRRVFLAEPEYCTFYDENGFTPYTHRVLGRFAEVPRSGASCYFVDMLNTFGDIGGYEAVCCRLEDAPVLHLSEMQVYASVLSAGTYCYTPFFWFTLWVRARRVFCERLKMGWNIINDTADVEQSVTALVEMLNGIAIYHDKWIQMLSVQSVLNTFSTRYHLLSVLVL